MWSRTLYVNTCCCCGCCRFCCCCDLCLVMRCVHCAQGIHHAECVILIIKTIFGNLMLSMRNIQNEVGELCWMLFFLFASFRRFFFNFCLFWPIFVFYIFYFVFFFLLLETRTEAKEWIKVSKGDREREWEKQNTDIFSYSIIWTWTTTFLCRGPTRARACVCAVFGQDDEWKSKWNFEILSLSLAIIKSMWTTTTTNEHNAAQPVRIEM